MTKEQVPGSPGRYRSRRLRRSGGAARWALWALGAVLAAFVVGYGVTALVFFPGSDRPPIVAVPDLRELHADEARDVADASGLDFIVGEPLPNADIPEGRVLSQSPLPGQEVAPGTPVRVLVSGGAERRSVPVVGSMSREQATAALQATGFEVAVQEVEDPMPAGRVVGIEPAPGTEMSIPATVTLRVSTGPPMVQVPDLAGLTQEAAKEILASAGLRVGEVEYRFAGFNAEEQVVWQEPYAGESVPEGSAIRIRIASDRLPGGY